MIFSSSIFGYMLKTLYAMSTRINWYGLIMLLAQFIAFTGIVFQLIKKENTIFSLLMAFLMIVLPVWSITLMLNFTTVAALLAVSGFMTLIHAKSKLEYLSAITIYSLGAIIRWESVLMVHLFVIPFILSDKSSFFNNIKRFSLVGIIIGLVLFTDYLTYQSPEWKSFKGLLKERIFLDFNQSERLGLKDEIAFQKAGCSKNDYQMLRNHINEDSNADRQIKLRKLKKIVSYEETNMLKEFPFLHLYLIQWLILLHPLHYFLFMIGFLTVFLFKPSKAIIAFALFVLITLVFAYYYPARYRGMAAVELAILGILLYVLSNNFHRIIKRKILIASLFLVSIPIYYFSLKSSYSLKGYRLYAENQLNYIKKNNNLNFLIVGSALSFEGLNPMKMYWTEDFSKFIYTAPGGSPYQQKALKRFNSNDFFELLMNQNSRLITRNEEIPQIIKTYLREHKSVNVEYTEIKQDAGFYCWQFKRQ